MEDDTQQLKIRVTALENYMLGMEIALSEVVFYAHDLKGQGVFNKDDLSSRLAKLLARLPNIYPEENMRNQISLPLARLAVGLRDAIRIDENGAPVQGDEKNGK